MRSLAQLLLTVLLNASWQIAVVTLFAVCCSWLVRGTVAWCRHTVWVAALVISLCLPIISGMNALELSPVPNQPKQNLAHIEPEPSVTSPASLQEIALTELSIVPVQMAKVVPARQAGWSSPISLSRNLAVVLVAFYAFFLLYRSYKLLRAWQRTRAIIRSAWSTQVPARAGAIISKCQTAIGVKRVRVVCSASVPLPITAGVFNPLIILPEQLLSEADEEVLFSAIGHELVHVARRDYLLNLIYELIYLPVSFHPAAAVLRRRIKQTRELCCDELVAKKLLAPEVYARSLVRLVGSVPLARRLSPDTTIGITDADILEVRIMSLLRTSKVSMRRNTLLLIAACLLLAAPCIAAAAFALHFDIDIPQPATGQKQESHVEVQKLERARAEMQQAREELQRKRREFEERVRNNPNAQGAELEKLNRMERELEEASAKLSHEQAAQYFNDAEQNLRQINEKLAHAMATYPEAEARMREAREKLEQLQKSVPENEARSRELQEQIAMTQKQFLDSKMKAEQVQYLRRAQEELALQQEALSQEQREKIEEKLKHERRIEEVVEQQEREAREKSEAVEDEIKNKIKSKEFDKQIRKDVDKRIRKELEDAGGEDRAKEQAELAQLATMSMDRAIQIAISQHPGQVLSCNLGRQGDGQAFYRLVIINGEGGKSSATHVWVSATDGRILKTEHE